MNMNEATAKFAVSRLKGKAADEANCSVVVDASQPCRWIALVLRTYYTV